MPAIDAAFMAALAGEKTLSRQPGPSSPQRLPRKSGDHLGHLRRIHAVFKPLLNKREHTKAAENRELVREARSIMSTQYITSDSERIIVTGMADDGFSGTPEEIAGLLRRLPAPAGRPGIKHAFQGPDRRGKSPGPHVQDVRVYDRPPVGKPGPGNLYHGIFPF